MKGRGVPPFILAVFCLASQLHGAAVLNSTTLWTGGIVYYTIDASVDAVESRHFLDAAGEWAMFANLQFIERTTQPNYLVVKEEVGLFGGFSEVGMLGGAQDLKIGDNAWNRGTLLHELGHALGFIHEHQRPDRNTFVTINWANINGGMSGSHPSFDQLSGVATQGAYDFLSIMHYPNNQFSTAPGNLITIQPNAGFEAFLDRMGAALDTRLSAGDRAGIAALYGAGPILSSVVTNTDDSGPGSLRQCLYDAFDHPSTTITFNIPATDPNLSGGVFKIRPTAPLPDLTNGVNINGASQPNNSNPGGPEIHLDGEYAQRDCVASSGLDMTDANCTVRGLVITGFRTYGIEIRGANASGNNVVGCYIGVDPTGMTAMPNGFAGIRLSDGAQSNIVRGNTISGNTLQGMLISGSNSNQVLDNLIGLDAAGNAAIPNTWSGLEVGNGSAMTEIRGNVISGNGNHGIMITGTSSDQNVMHGNLIGLNAAGTSGLGNTWRGIAIYGGNQNVVGNGTLGNRNHIAANGNYGIEIGGALTTQTRIQGNSIGVDVLGNSLGNTWSGVGLTDGANGNLIGGISLGEGNFIAHNNDAGVVLFDVFTVGNSILSNAIHDNGWEGIYFGNDPNHGQAAPTLSSAVLADGLRLMGSLTSAANSTYRIEFFANPSAAFPWQGKQLIGVIAALNTNASGLASFDETLPIYVAAGQGITATATSDATGDTSRFSSALTVVSTDTDSDRMPDSYETANGLNANVADDMDDLDHDGVSNYAEMVSGTDPMTYSEGLRSAGISNSGGVVLSFESVLGKYYRIQYGDIPNVWRSLLDNIPGTGGILQVTDNTAIGLDRRFYQVTVLP